MNPKANYGFSLAEMLTSLAIISVMSVGASQLHTMYSKHQLNEAQSNLGLLVRRSRHDAYTLQTRVTLCVLSQTGTCNQDWTGTISAFTDHNGNRKLDANDIEISRVDVHPSIVVRWKGMKPNNSIHFSPTGFTFVSNGTFTLCLPQHQETIELVINKQGRPRLERTTQTCKN